MTVSHRSNHAFTLIELLIVVAIIAVLAAIAVPNFLEAQTRAKVSRVKGDIRTVSIAMEAYAIDCNHYPYCDPHLDHAYLADIPMLTTPIAYLADLPREVFPSPNAAGRTLYYRYYPMSYWIGVFPQLRLRNWKWILISNGPNRLNDLTQGNAQAMIDGQTDTFYDPTNGTISYGDVFASNMGILESGRK